MLGIILIISRKGGRLIMRKIIIECNYLIMCISNSVSWVDPRSIYKMTEFETD